MVMNNLPLTRTFKHNELHELIYRRMNKDLSTEPHPKILMAYIMNSLIFHTRLLLEWLLELNKYENQCQDIKFHELTEFC